MSWFSRAPAPTRPRCPFGFKPKWREALDQRPVGGGRLRADRRLQFLEPAASIESRHSQALPSLLGGRRPRVSPLPRFRLERGRLCALPFDRPHDWLLDAEALLLTAWAAAIDHAARIVWCFAWRAAGPSSADAPTWPGVCLSAL